jgi:hypothetical protein
MLEKVNMADEQGQKPSFEDLLAEYVRQIRNADDEEIALSRVKEIYEWGKMVGEQGIAKQLTDWLVPIAKSATRR